MTKITSTESLRNFGFLRRDFGGKPVYANGRVYKVAGYRVQDTYFHKRKPIYKNQK